MVCVYSSSCCCAWRMSKIQPSQWCSVYSSDTLPSSVGFTSAASRESSTRWCTTWHLRMMLPPMTSSGSALAASKVLTSSVEFDILCQCLVISWHHGHIAVIASSCITSDKLDIKTEAVVPYPSDQNWASLTHLNK